MPPLVNAPSASGKPTKSATHRSACSSTSSAPPADATRLMSYVAARAEASTPISSPVEPM